MFIDDATTVEDSVMLNNDYYQEPQTYQHCQNNKLTCNYRRFNAITNDIMIQGSFNSGSPYGRWVYYNQQGDKAIYEYQSFRSGARCGDGTYSSATGRGACSWHGGVAEWLYSTQKVFVQGTGAFQPINSRHPKIRQQAMKVYGIRRNGSTLEDQWQLFKQAIKKHKASHAAKDIIEELQQQNQGLYGQVESKDKTIVQLQQKIKEMQVKMDELQQKINKTKQQQKQDKIQQKQEKSPQLNLSTNNNIAKSVNPEEMLIKKLQRLEQSSEQGEQLFVQKLMGQLNLQEKQQSKTISFADNQFQKEPVTLEKHPRLTQLITDKCLDKQSDFDQQQPEVADGVKLVVDVNDLDDDLDDDLEDDVDDDVLVQDNSDDDIQNREVWQKEEQNQGGQEQNNESYYQEQKMKQLLDIIKAKMIINSIDGNDSHSDSDSESQ